MRHGNHRQLLSEQKAKSHWNWLLEWALLFILGPCWAFCCCCVSSRECMLRWEKGMANYFLLKSSLLLGWWRAQGSEEIELSSSILFSLCVNLSFRTQVKLYQSGAGMMEQSAFTAAEHENHIYLLSRPFSWLGVFIQCTDSEILHTQQLARIREEIFLPSTGESDEHSSWTPTSLWFGHATRTKRNSMRVRKSLFFLLFPYAAHKHSGIFPIALRTHLILIKHSIELRSVQVHGGDIYILNKQ